MKLTDSSDVKVGVTKVDVFRSLIDERTQRETTVKCHSGIVLGKTSSFLAVFNPAPKDQGGDISPEFSQWHPMNGKRAWCETIGELSEPMTIPAIFQT